MMRPPSRPCVRRCAVAAVLALCLATAGKTSVHAQTTSLEADIDGAVAEAAARFDLPTSWIRAVMRVESAGAPRAVSGAGAMGLMQIMPSTWRELRSRHGLGEDPFEPRDNILAGAAYMRELFDRYGAPGFLAAYNAGPRRYESALTSGVPLPAETRDYMAKLSMLVTGEARASPRAAQDPRHSSLFGATGGPQAEPLLSLSPPTDTPASFSAITTGGLFPRRPDEPER